MARRQPDELLAPAGEEWLATDNEPVGMQLEEGRKSGVDFVFGAGLENRELHPLRACHVLRLSRDAGGGICTVRVHE